MEDLAPTTAVEATRALRERRVGALELLEFYLERVERLNGSINAVVALDAEGARARAREADAALARGESWGPLHGLPMTIKDSLEVVGMTTTSGAPELEDHRPERNADSVQRLLDAGAVIFGKTNLPLYAGDFQSYNEVYGTTGNPWNTERVPGGSSGGAAAALAAGLTPLELGSDIGGSIRNPAHFCGVYGHKPSYGIVPMRGHIPGPPGTLADGDLAVVGPLARSAADLDIALEVLAGPDPRSARGWRLELPPPRRSRLGDFRVAAWLDDAECPVSSDLGELLESAVSNLEREGVSVDRKARPVDPEASFGTYVRLLYSVMGAGFPPALLRAFDAAYPALQSDDHSLPSEMVRAVARPHREWLRDHERRAQLRAGWDAFFERFDVLIAPIMPTAAFAHDHSPFESRTLEVNGKTLPYLQQVFWAGLATVAYLPSTVAPIGLTPSGLPVGIQVIGPYLEDRSCIEFARQLTQRVGGFRTPPGFA